MLIRCYLYAVMGANHQAKNNETQDIIRRENELKRIFLQAIGHYDT